MGVLCIEREMKGNEQRCSSELDVLGMNTACKGSKCKEMVVPAPSLLNRRMGNSAES